MSECQYVIDMQAAPAAAAAADAADARYLVLKLVGWPAVYWLISLTDRSTIG